jgi:FG-GAP-like repeat
MRPYTDRYTARVHQPGSSVRFTRFDRGRRFRPGVEGLEARTLRAIFLVDTTADSGLGSFRQAIVESNAVGGTANTITFDIPGMSPHVIVLESPLPPISIPVLIDGFSQPGYSGAPLVELSGRQSGGGNGLLIDGSRVTVRALDITGFSEGAGIDLTGPAATNDWVYSDDIGTDPTGTQAEPNEYGVEIDGGATENVIGSNTSQANGPADGSLISGNDMAGVLISGQATTGNVVAGNDIGTGFGGTGSLPNGGPGIEIATGASDNTIGGLTTGAGNRISNNVGPGVQVDHYYEQPTADEIVHNAIFGNAGLAIALGSDSVSYNSSTPGPGANNVQNFPIVGTNLHGQLEGWLGGSTPLTTFHLEFFASSAFGPDGAGEAQDYLGSLEVTTNSAGEAVFQVPFTPPAGLPIVTATATDPSGNTSEVSAERRTAVQAPTGLVPLTSGQPLLFSQAGGDAISLSDEDAGPLAEAWAWTLTLSVPVGTLTLASTNGLVGAGDGTDLLSYTGSLSAIDAALNGMSYVTPSSFRGETVVDLDAQSEGSQLLTAQVFLTNGVYTVTTTADSGPGSLRDAITNANATPGGGSIDFAIPRDGVHTIDLASALPAITNTVLIDGTTEPGYAGVPLVAINAQQAGTADSLTVDGGDLTVRGLITTGFALGQGTTSGAVSIQSGELPPSQSATGSEVDSYRIDTATNGRLIALVDPEGMPTGLSLLSSTGQLLVRSNSVSATDPENLINENVPAGTYFLEVQRTTSRGSYSLTMTLTPASVPFQPQTPPQAFPGPVIVGDFNGDGIPDVVTPEAIDLGVGDGTFQDLALNLGYISSFEPLTSMVGADFTGDGKLDLAVSTNLGSLAIGMYGQSSGVYVLLGNGDGTFQTPEQVATGSFDSVVTGDFAGSDDLDLAVADAGDVNSLYGTDPGGVYLILGKGNGTFQVPQQVASGSFDSLVTGHFTNDGNLDLAAIGSDGAYVLLGDGNGNFVSPLQVASGSFVSIVTGDFTGNGKLDLAVSGPDGVYVVLGNGNGTFQSPVKIASGSFGSLVAGDFTDDGKLDLAAAGTDGVYLMLGNGDGSFQPATEIPTQSQPIALAAADLTGNGTLDLVMENTLGSIQTLLGNGDGTFQAPRQNYTGNGPNSMVVAGFAGNGELDVATANSSGTISMLLGNGDGTFQPQQQFQVGPLGQSDLGPLVDGDFNGDGRLDLAVVDVGDLNIQGGTDPGGIYVLLGNGDGTFQTPFEVASGTFTALVAGNFTRDGDLDLAMLGSGRVYVVLGNGNGTFQQPKLVAAGSYFYLSTVQATAGGPADLVASGFAGNLVILSANSVGSFQPPQPYLLAKGSLSAPADSSLLGNDDAVSGEFTADGLLDEAVADGSDVTVMLAQGNGTLQAGQTIATEGEITALAVGDFNNDGRLDLAVLNSTINTVSIFLGNGDGTFVAANALGPPLTGTPLVADVKGDGSDDVLEVDSAGDILYRQAVPGEPDTFEPPVTINPGFPSRDIAFVPMSDDGPLIASVDVGDDALSLYSWRDGNFVRIGSVTTGPFPVQVIAAELNANGLADLVVRDAGNGTLTVLFNNGLGPLWNGFTPFDPAVTILVGLGTSDVSTLDTRGNGSLDLVVTNALSGQVSVVRNEGNDAFAAPVPYAAGTSLSWLVASGGTDEVTSLEATAGVAGGELAPGDAPDLVTIDPGSNTLAVLAGLSQGGFANPSELQTPDAALAVRVADFQGDGMLGLAVLTENGVSIYLGTGSGGFAAPVTYVAGANPTGLTVADILGNGIPDLLVGDAFGDLLVLINNGNGTFKPYRNTDQQIELAVGNLTGTGTDDIVYADQGLDRVVVQYGRGQADVVGDQSTGILDPGAVKLADLTGNGIPDLIVANSGGNNILIYPGLGNGQFGPPINGGQGYFVGTDPVGVTVANLISGDPRPDLVIANKGSNDLSILLNESEDGSFDFREGQARLDAGYGPVGTAVGDFTGNGVPDILVSDSETNQVLLLPGIGGGFFNDQNPRSFNTGINPGQPIVGPFGPTTDLVTVNAGSNDLTMISDFEGPNPVTSTISAGGLDPVADFEFTSGDGFDDLVVANYEDGAISLLEGGPNGLSLSSSHIESNLPNPTALAYSAFTGGLLQFYEATAGREAVNLVTLMLFGPSALPSLPPSPAFPTLLALDPSGLLLVATLLPLTLDQSPIGADLDASAIDAPAATASSGVVSSPGQAPVTNPSGAGLDDHGGQYALLDTSANLELSRSQLGPTSIYRPDEELERFRGKNRGTIFTIPEPPPWSENPEPVPADDQSSLEEPGSGRAATSSLPSILRRPARVSVRPARHSVAGETLWRPRRRVSRDRHVPLYTAFPPAGQGDLVVARSNDRLRRVAKLGTSERPARASGPSPATARDRSDRVSRQLSIATLVTGCTMIYRPGRPLFTRSAPATASSASPATPRSAGNPSSRRKRP